MQTFAKSIECIQELFKSHLPTDKLLFVEWMESKKTPNRIPFMSLIQLCDDFSYMRCFFLSKLMRA